MITLDDADCYAPEGAVVVEIIPVDIDGLIAALWRHQNGDPRKGIRPCSECDAHHVCDAGREDMSGYLALLSDAATEIETPPWAEPSTLVDATW